MTAVIGRGRKPADGWGMDREEKEESPAVPHFSLNGEEEERGDERLPSSSSFPEVTTPASLSSSCSFSPRWSVENILQKFWVSVIHSFISKKYTGWMKKGGTTQKFCHSFQSDGDANNKMKKRRKKGGQSIPLDR